MGKVPRGLPKSYIKKWGISKLAWKKFRAGALTKGIRTRTRAIKRRIRRSKSSRSSKTKTNPKKVRRMVRRYRRGRRRGGKSLTRTAFKLVRLGALAGPAVGFMINPNVAPENRVKDIIRAYTGYNYMEHTWNIQWMAEGWMPYIMACLVTYGIPKLTSIIRRL